MQNQNLLKERNGASSKPETQTPSSTLDTAVVVIDKMTGFDIWHQPMSFEDCSDLKTFQSAFIRVYPR